MICTETLFSSSLCVPVTAPLEAKKREETKKKATMPNPHVSNVLLSSAEVRRTSDQSKRMLYRTAFYGRRRPHNEGHAADEETWQAGSTV